MYRTITLTALLSLQLLSAQTAHASSGSLAILQIAQIKSTSANNYIKGSVAQPPATFSTKKK